MATLYLDLDRLFRLRLVVGRYGEMDGARWWNTTGMLGRHGAAVLRRGFPSTHHFAQARVVFAVARARCEELFSPPGCMTLWNLPAAIEDEFDEHWQSWLDEVDNWTPLFQSLRSMRQDDLLATLLDFGLITSAHAAGVRNLRRSDDGHSVALPGLHSPGDDVIGLLAAGFSHGEPARVAVPYARLDTSA